MAIKIAYFIERNKSKTAEVNSLPKRNRKTPERFMDMVFIPGSNNKKTAGRRPIDPYDRQYNGW